MHNERRTAYLGIGDQMPNLQLPGLDGGECAVTSLRGKFALLFLWASW